MKNNCLFLTAWLPVCLLRLATNSCVSSYLLKPLKMGHKNVDLFFGEISNYNRAQRFVGNAAKTGLNVAVVGDYF